MSLKPIDLQTLFMKMAEVSKEQSFVKEQAALQQSLAARSQVANELEADHRVTETPEESEAQAVKEDESESGGEQQGRQEAKSEGQSDNTGGKEVVTDPDVGQHVDLTG